MPHLLWQMKSDMQLLLSESGQSVMSKKLSLWGRTQIVFLSVAECDIESMWVELHSKITAISDKCTG